MTDHAYLSTASVAIILVCVAMLAIVTAAVLEIFGEPERSYTVVLFVSLLAIWATAVLVLVLIRLPI